MRARLSCLMEPATLFVGSVFSQAQLEPRHRSQTGQRLRFVSTHQSPRDRLLRYLLRIVPHRLRERGIRVNERKQ